MRSRGSPSSLPFLNLSPWSSRIKNIVLPHPKHYYATESPKHDDGTPSWIHNLTLGFSSWIHSHRDPVPPQHAQSSKGKTNRWVHYTTLGLWRDASQDQIKKRYYELSRQHHPDVSQDPSSPDIFGKVTEAYAVLGKKKTRRKYDQYEQLHSALITGLRHQRAGELASSEPRPVDPTFWDPVKSGSSMFYRPPAGYWSAMNKLTRDRELKEREKAKLQAQAASSSSQKAMPSHDGPEENEIDSEARLSEFQLQVIIVAFTAVFAVVYVDRVKKLLGYTRAQALQENNESDSSASQGCIEDPTSQSANACASADGW
ncbi:hypothetical protein C8R48DRAFT_771710 [Suillus tomentosus]|nr:hypothetical protein C8R48DRAFT_771710 [Suillus tomentosus]